MTAKFQRDVAHALRPWWPSACFAHDDESHTTPDNGDLAETSSGLFWSLEDVEMTDNSKPSLILGWMLEARDKANGRLPLLVQKRRGHADPLKSWCWLDLSDLILLCNPGFLMPEPDGSVTPVRMELHAVIKLLAENDYTDGTGPAS